MLNFLCRRAKINHFTIMCNEKSLLFANGATFVCKWSRRGGAKDHGYNGHQFSERKPVAQPFTMVRRRYRH